MQENKETNEYYENGICKKCKQAYIDTSEGKYSILCSECREQQIQYPIPKILIGIGILLLVLVVRSIILIINNFY
ncbi:hypothetical protein [Clostridium uliginosum]|uniref:Uncharacterized protein n=1 Tax=Clostridium uliginosum TaxID=119641 RepID=A0A1I1J4B9_9CLOT|nr:hypothetical protein [Clostridium uliginosum]SFC40300.1 hypothetical protein SAMN05421842_10392 [Clostridium uliginosum]